MKKLVLVLLAVLTGLVTVIYVNELLKGLLAYLITGKEINFLFNGILLKVKIPFGENISLISYAILLAFPYLISLFFIEIGFLVHRKNNNINFRLGLVIFQLINIGYIVINVFVLILAVLFRGLLTNNWVRLLDYSQIDYTKQLLVMLLILILLFTYINFCTNRIKKYMTIVREK